MSRKFFILLNWSFLLKMWNKKFNIVIYTLPPLDLVTKTICPLCTLVSYPLWVFYLHTLMKHIPIPVCGVTGFKGWELGSAQDDPGFTHAHHYWGAFNIIKREVPLVRSQGIKVNMSYLRKQNSWQLRGQCVGEAGSYLLLSSSDSEKWSYITFIKINFILFK